MQVGDSVHYDSGPGFEAWEILWFNDDEVQLVNIFGGTIYVPRGCVEDLN